MLVLFFTTVGERKQLHVDLHDLAGISGYFGEFEEFAAERAQAFLHFAQPCLIQAQGQRRDITISLIEAFEALCSQFHHRLVVGHDV